MRGAADTVSTQCVTYDDRVPRTWRDLEPLVVARHERWRRELGDDLRAMSSSKEPIDQIGELAGWIVSLHFHALTASPEESREQALRVAPPFEAVAALPGGSLITHEREAFAFAMYLELLECAGIDAPRVSRIAAHVRHVLLHGRFTSWLEAGTRQSVALLALAHGELDAIPSLLDDDKPLRKTLDAKARFDNDAAGLARHLATAIRIGASWQDVEKAWTSFVKAAPSRVAFDQDDARYSIWDLVMLARAVATQILGLPPSRTFGVLREMLEGTFSPAAVTRPSPKEAWRETTERFASRVAHFERELDERATEVTNDLAKDNVADAAMDLRWVASYALMVMLGGRLEPAREKLRKVAEAFGEAKLKDAEDPEQGHHPMLSGVLFTSFIRAARIEVPSRLATAEARWWTKLAGRLRDLEADDKRQLAFVALARGDDDLALKLAKASPLKKLPATWAIHEPLGFVRLAACARRVKARDVLVAMFESLVSQAPGWTSERLFDDESLVMAACLVFDDEPLVRFLDLVR